MPRPRDYQKSRVYRFDSMVKLEYGDHALLNWDDTRSMVNTIRKENNFIIIDDIYIADGRACRWGRGGIRNGKPYIQLPKACRTKTIICHEMAHVIVWQLQSDKRLSGHGKEFMYVYFSLLEQFADCNRNGLHVIRQVCKVEIAHALTHLTLAAQEIS